ncbi:hypothetical protein Htur_1757 [Haloterrigena turkmenica DSM 5511]|uniref:Yip1 domain-containing protein n=1 Tax=Haloterrigena turkmenica (strain ATCC 51198 / DSM 5511 / JCM 9101 / NCIMB 13204 / VKM B-1734 / 4k) TaxID=543526 RepID=D2RS61_HALTV|nr:hypothetical protein [Haloterrigena turkmenica]ADB60642.1 hypothetical protein Htur_1757 [Haloterrigena turkmenica DSM 5511]
MTLVDALATVLYHGYGGTQGWTGFANEGTWIIFAVILVPIYVMLVAWFVGTPRDTRTGLLGVSYLVGITTSMWVSMLVLTVILGLVFFGELPGQ